MTRSLVLLGLLAAVPAAAQARYRPQPDTLVYESVNPHHMYFVRGGDTLGTPIRAASLNRQLWSADGAGLRVRQQSRTLRVRGTDRTEVYELTPRGVVRAIDGDPRKVQGQFDLVMRLPADGDLRPGRVWHDTLDQVMAVPGGEYAYQAVRELRVERMADTLGGRMAVIRSTGRLRYRQTEQADTLTWWMDVSGPVDETVLFDVDRGRMAVRAWRMDLRGTGALPAGPGRRDTVPAGLVSADTTRLVTALRARQVDGALPAGDTTVTRAAQGEIMLHTVRRDGATLHSAFRLNDGTTMRVTARHEGGRAVRYALSSVRPHEPVLERVVELRGNDLRVTGDRDTTLAVPQGPWTMADHGMEEHLADVILRLGTGKEARTEERAEGEVMVLRPFTLTWERARVQVIAVEDAFVGIVRTEPEGIRDVTRLLLVDRDGDLLYVEGGEPGRFARVPPEGSARYARMERLLGALARCAEERSGGKARP